MTPRHFALAMIAAICTIPFLGCCDAPSCADADYTLSNNLCVINPELSPGDLALVLDELPFTMPPSFYESNEVVLSWSAADLTDPVEPGAEQFGLTRVWTIGLVSRAWVDIRPGLNPVQLHEAITHEWTHLYLWYRDRDPDEAHLDPLWVGYKYRN